MVGTALLAIGLYFLIRRLYSVSNNQQDELNEKEEQKPEVPKEHHQDLIFADLIPDVSMDRIEVKDDSPPRKLLPRKKVKRARAI